LCRSFWDDAHNGTAADKLQFMMRQLPLMTAWCRITTLELPRRNMKGQDAENLVGVLAQCPALAHINLSGNCNFGSAGTERLAGVLGQCRELVHLNLSDSNIRAAGAESLAGVMRQCRELVHLDLGCNRIRTAGGNGIGEAGAESLFGMLAQCTALAHLDLSYNDIGKVGAERFAGVLGQCAALVHLDLCENWIEEYGTGSTNCCPAFPACQALGLPPKSWEFHIRQCLVWHKMRLRHNEREKELTSKIREETGEGPV
jgi:hypothetical protein